MVRDEIKQLVYLTLGIFLLGSAAFMYILNGENDRYWFVLTSGYAVALCTWLVVHAENNVTFG
ncbi:hypothetical protein GCM10011297_33300 [Bacterioplanes sanyensis]|uniref:hypothetical protein n=1 Tax=Bacterioplanes sanyensis TaxID=1249553 RepID=UPI0016792258|nr:hypothetical protein [Bacterioplanes sanyensis]GGY57962.1 hypothetical protein GCM10011297_33300 [Bacterioplanes sanyensis]